MFDKLKMKYMAKRMQQKKDFAAEKKFIADNATKFGRVVLWPLRMIGRGVRWIWDTICAICYWIWTGLCEINIVGMVNLALLVAIIVLCSMLILDVWNWQRDTVVVQNVPVEFTGKKQSNEVPLPKQPSDTKDELPVANVVPTTPSKDVTLKPQGDGNIYGDVIIESRGEAIMIKNGARIRGNLYLQHMRKYVLPCNITIEGNLFLRDLHVLQFCGEFSVGGNIYVSPRSSFGPIPRNAKIGGQIIL